LGKAFADAINNWVVVLKEDCDGNPTHWTQNIVLFGDPAFKMYVPQKPIVQPARVVHQGNTISAYGPDVWTMNSDTGALATEWKWPGQLYYYGAPGVVPHYYWAGKYDKSKPYLFARFHTDRQVIGLKKLDEATGNLGWQGEAYIDEHFDGSRTMIWRIRLLDYNTETGAIVAKLDQQSYHILYG